MQRAFDRGLSSPARRRWVVGLLFAAAVLPFCNCTDPNELGMFDLTVFVLAPDEDQVLQQPKTILVRWSDLGPRSSDTRDLRWDDPPVGSTIVLKLSPTDSEDSADDVAVYGPVDAVEDGAADTFEFAGWDAAGLPVELGEYSFLVQLDDGETIVEGVAPGGVQVPFHFLNPLADHNLQADGALTIEWEDDPVNLGSLTITLLLDDDSEDENEGAVELLRGRPLDEDGVGLDDFVWAGRDADGQYVPQGTYDLVARLRTNEEENFFIRALGRIIMPLRDIPAMEITFPAYEEDGDPVDVFMDEPFTITWTDSDADNDAIITLITGNTFREDVIAEGLSEDADGSAGSFVWTGGRNIEGDLIESGLYFLVGLIEDPDNGPIEAQGARLALRPRTAGNVGPLVQLSDPREALQLRNGDTITITWDDDDPDDDARVSLFYEDEDGVRTPIPGAQDMPEDPDGEDEDSFRWTLADVPDGEFTLVVTITDGVNSDENRSPEKFTIPEEPNQAPTLEFTAPEEDVDVSYGETLLITWDAEDEEQQAIITLGVDVDGNHQNGNETVIATDLLEGVHTELLWDLTDLGAELMPTRMDYRVYGIINDGIASLVYSEADGRVNIRLAPGAPLIKLTQPASNRTIDPGAVIQISWEFDTGSGGAQVILYYDDDDDPSEPDPGTEIVSGIDPEIFSTHTWVTPDDLGEGLPEDDPYIWIHAVITNTDGEDRDTAKGRLTVNP